MNYLCSLLECTFLIPFYANIEYLSVKYTKVSIFICIFVQKIYVKDTIIINIKGNDGRKKARISYNLS